VTHLQQSNRAGVVHIDTTTSYFVTPCFTFTEVYIFPLLATDSIPAFLLPAQNRLYRSRGKEAGDALIGVCVTKMDVEQHQREMALLEEKRVNATVCLHFELLVIICRFCCFVS
jgi:hypothetical protein